MDNVNEVSARVLYPDGSSRPGDISVLSEHVLTVIVNEKPVYRLVCTKSHIRELVYGRLLTDGLIGDAEEIVKIYICEMENRARVFLDHMISWEETIREDLTCCTGNKVYASSERKTELKTLSGSKWHPEWVFRLAGEFGKGTELHRLTGGNHICFLAREGQTCFVSEDIGRHNSVDKAVGYALLHQIPLSECLLFTSGRVPVDMVEKVIAAGVPVLISKSVPTKESLELAKEYGLTLICMAWPDQCVLF